MIFNSATYDYVGVLAEGTGAAPTSAFLSQKAIVSKVGQRP